MSTRSDSCSASALTVNTWARVSATYDGSNIRLYKNGAAATGGTNPKASTRTITPGSNLRVGVTGYNATTSPFLGNMGDVIVWKRCLSPTEEAAIETAIGVSDAAFIAAISVLEPYAWFRTAEELFPAKTQPR